MQEGTRRDMRAVYVEHWEDCRYYTKHNGIALCYFEHVSKRHKQATFILL